MQQVCIIISLWEGFLSGGFCPFFFTVLVSVCEKYPEVNLFPAVAAILDFRSA